MKRKGDDGILKDATFKCKINLDGNWNRKGINGYVKGKPLGIVIIDGIEYCWKHDEIKQLIKLYYDADKLAIDMINSIFIDTGEVNNSETSFLNKLKIFIQELENNKNNTK